MPEHLSREQISALLDDPKGVQGGLEHMAECPECAREYEQMSRMRMALSGLTQLEPPSGEWDAVQRRMGLEPIQQPGAGSAWRHLRAWPLQAAAVLALFAAGLMVGQRMGSGGEAPAPASSADETLVANAESAMSIEPAEAYLRTVADLQDLRRGLDGHADGAQGPERVAERITHLDAMIDASRDALREAPADPVLNNFLFQLVDERNDLAGQLDQTLRMTAEEY
jgi:anti-sigma factor RsiW